MWDENTLDGENSKYCTKCKPGYKSGDDNTTPSNSDTCQPCKKGFYKTPDGTKCITWASWIGDAGVLNHFVMRSRLPMEHSNLKDDITVGAPFDWEVAGWTGVGGLCSHPRDNADKIHGVRWWTNVDLGIITERSL